MPNESDDGRGSANSTNYRERHRPDFGTTFLKRKHAHESGNRDKGERDDSVKRSNERGREHPQNEECSDGLVAHHLPTANDIASISPTSSELM